MNKPILLVMAAGMGSRYGGLKQLDRVGEYGELLIDYAIKDAMKAGFKKVVFIIKKEFEIEFKEAIGNRLEKYIQVEYAYQEIKDVPIGIHVPEDRVKPLGTAHAIYAAREHIISPFCVINADDYYGPKAFNSVFKFLEKMDGESYDYCMVGYNLHNTLTDHGFVSRGVCQVNEQNYLMEVTERTHIEKYGDKAICENENDKLNDIKEESIVSMNMWGFTETIIEEIEEGFLKDFRKLLLSDPYKSEFYIPFVVDKVIEKKKGRVKVLHTDEKWFGVTYSQDKERVVDKLAIMVKEGKYTSPLW